MTESVPVIQTKDLCKSFRLGLRRKKVEALRGVSIAVESGQIFGFLGPNGAGKTTTIKTIVGLLRPTSGECFLLGQRAGGVEARRRIGYLPESPYFYDHLLPDEFMDLCGRLRGLSRRQRRQRGGELLERVGLDHARDRPLRKFSKGMLQRIGLAQSILGQPELLILDEPMTGLDPVGRKEVRDLIVELRDRGMTIFFSSHILSDVESLCDRVAIVHRGVVVDQGALDDLLAPAGRFVDIVVEGEAPLLPETLADAGVERQQRGDQWVVTSRGDETLNDTLRWLLESHVRIHSVIPRRETLEKLFLRRAIKVPSDSTTKAAS
jgi:ABC-2 type transport system ATP-binding protein